MNFDPNDFRLDIDSARPSNKKDAKGIGYCGTRFLKGPIPWEWLCIAAKLPGKALQVAMGLWFIAGLTKNRVVKMQKKIREEMGISRAAFYDGVMRLEDAKLISVNSRVGRAPTIHIMIPQIPEMRNRNAKH